MLKIQIPNSQFTGRRAGLWFTEGKYLDDEKHLGSLSAGQLFNFNRWGYTVTGDAAPEGSVATASRRGKKGATDGEE
jgi:hypothetical protein